MGNEANSGTNGVNQRGNYPLKISLADIKTKVSIQGVKFQQSPYNIEQEKFVVKPFMDKEIRDSQFCYVPMPQLSQQSLDLLQTYFNKLPGFDDEYDQINNQWRLTKYNVQGHFLQHHDRQKKLQDHQHFGTQIFLPPFSECKFQGGQLRIEINKQIQDVLPHDTLWTHIIMPLGIEHQVMKVTGGMRISYVKEIWLKEDQQPIETDQDRQIRQLKGYSLRNNIRRLD